MPRKCAFGCSPSEIPMHRFPDAAKSPEELKSWVRLVGGKLETSSDYEYFKKKRICDIHFSDIYRNRNKRLNRLAVPTLHLPRQSEVILEPPSTSTQQLQPVESHPDIIEQSARHVVLNEASTSTQHPLYSISQPVIAEQSARHVVLNEASTSTQHPLYSISQPVIAGTSNNRLDYVIREHNYSVMSKRTVRKDLNGPLRSKIKLLQSEVSRLRKKGKSYKARLKSAEDFSLNALWQQVAVNLKKPAQLFLSMQLKSSKKPKGRRFTTEEKVLSLSLYKKSPKCYGFLNNIFTLPSVKAMKRLLSAIKIKPGINPLVFERIKKTILKEEVTDRLCSLMFDEMSLTPQINYNTQKDMIEGFANNKNTKFADHALVFMIKVIKKKIKQPIAYYFTTKLNKIELKNFIIEVIKYAQDSGLTIINTVCDQSTVNVGAINDMVNDTKAKYLRCGKDWRHDHILINGRKIIPIYDVPHLIKGIRNNLINKDLVYTTNNNEKVVKWEYYQKVYAADKSYGELRLLNKITEEHINAEKINKMKVKSATQLFSHSVAVATEHLCARGDLPQECSQLIEITLLLDNLFDSLNGNTLHIPNGKIYKGPIKKRSPHHELWKKAILILKSIKFRYHKKIVNANKTRLIETTIPSVINLIKTIEGMQSICNLLSEKYRFDAVLPRNFNQDPVENFFGNIRSYGARNNSPNSLSFESAYKALLINNYKAAHSNRANCEEDSNSCLQTLEFFFTEKQNVDETSDAPNENETIEINEEVLDSTRNNDLGQRNYVCGWVLTKCLKNVVKTCDNCKETLLDKGNKNINNNFIKAKEYTKKKWLCYPSEALENCFHDLQNITTAVLKKNLPKKNVKFNIKLLADAMVDYPFNCTTHKEQLRTYFVNITINVILFSWCRSINRILSGKLTYDGDDETKTAAQEYYNKFKHYKNKK